MREVSVIVPVYNSAEYLESCVESILVQTYSASEIILVDNGSKDGSVSICEELSAKYKNVKSYLYTEKRGPGAARNYGLKQAKGEVIGFCDSDDYIQPNMIEEMMFAIENGADYVIADMYGERIRSNLGLPWPDGAVFNDREIHEQCVPLFIGNLSDNDNAIPVWGSVVRCLFLKSIIEQHAVCFPEDLRFAEDLVFTLRYLKYASHFHVVNQPLYHYRYNETSLMNSYSRYQPDMWNSRKKLIKLITAELHEMDIESVLSERLNCTVRAYVHECVGNASKQDGFMNSYQEVRSIIRSEYAVRAFRRFDAKSLKKRIPYFMIKHRFVFLLAQYYRMRRKI